MGLFALTALQGERSDVGAARAKRETGEGCVSKKSAEEDGWATGVVGMCNCRESGLCES